ncbi:MAG: hypothetical protein IKE89_05595 [Bacilli bacterium]|nr:hypothetical protein [Bacilli bacterium]
MIEYRIINNFFHNGNKRIILVDKNNKYFFLDENRNYINLDEFIDISKIVSVNQNNIRQFFFQKKKSEKITIIPKVIVNGLLVPLTSSVLMTGCAAKEVDYKEIANNISVVNALELDENSQKAYDEYLDTVNDETTLFEEASIKSNEFGTFINDSKGLDTVLNNTKADVTYDDIRRGISNLDTTEEVKEIYTTLANNLEQQYPNLDLRIWDINLKSMKIETKSKEMFDAMGMNLGFYSIDTNTITLQEGLEFTPGTLEYQMVVHEMGHTIRESNFSIDGNNYYCRFSTDFNNYDFTSEALNSILTLRSYDQKETHIAYTLTSHMFEVMLESMDNYTMEDYINEDITYLIEKLNETNGDKMAIEILNLLELKCRDTKDESFYIPQNYYYRLYDYVARMYYNKYITDDMSPEEIKQVKDNLVIRLTTDISPETEIDTAHFDDYIGEYCKERNINYTAPKKTK